MSLETIIQSSPVWVWVLLVVLISRGFKALGSRTAPLSKLAIVPLVFAGWGIAHLVSNPALEWSVTFAWLASAGVGILCGVLIASRSGFVVDPIANTVTLPGSVLPLLMMSATFVAKFWLGVQLATVTDASSLAMVVLTEAIISGAVAGIFCGRFLVYWRALSARRVIRAH